MPGGLIATGVIAGLTTVMLVLYYGFNSDIFLRWHEMAYCLFF
jgi:hypothetical protein